MKQLGKVFVAIALTLGILSAPAAAATPAQKCAALKKKAAGKKALHKLRCYAAADLKNRAVDANCLSAAEVAFDRAFAMAEQSGGCALNGDAAAIEAMVDAFVNGVVAAIPSVAPTPTPTATATLTPTMTPVVTPGKIVFLTSTSQTGALGGLAGADGICASLASAAGRPGTYKAWLSDSATSAAARLTHAAVPYYRVDGTKVANDWADLTDGSLLAPIDVDENGVVADTAVWTYTHDNGSAATDVFDYHCADWSSGLVSNYGVIGSSNGTPNWSFTLYYYCNSAFALYCLQQ